MWCAFFFTYTYAEMPEWSKGLDSRPTASLRADSNPALGKRVSGWMPEWSKGMDFLRDPLLKYARGFESRS